jgi:hypothetical protein
MHPTVTIKAERTICDLECMLPTGSGVPEKVAVVKPCKLTLPHLGAAIVFNGDAITLFADDAKMAKNGYLFDHLVHFLIYSSRVDYCGYCNWLADKTLEGKEEVGRTIVFNLERDASAHKGTSNGIGKVAGRFVCLDIEALQLEVDREPFDLFHEMMDMHLAHAIAFFLAGCANPTYFLVELYKSTESIRHAFRDEKSMLNALAPYGLARKPYKAFTQAANDTMQPIAFGRHAPKGKSVFGIDIRSLSHPMTIQGRLFREAMQMNRDCIDAYIAVRIKKTRS